MTCRLILIVFQLYMPQLGAEDIAIRRVMIDRISALKDKGELGRASMLANTALKKFPSNIELERLSRRIDYLRISLVPELTNDLNAGDLAKADYVLHWVSDLDAESRATVVHLIAEQIKKKVDPDAWYFRQSIIAEYSSNSFLKICTTKQNHAELRKFLDVLESTQFGL